VRRRASALALYLVCTSAFALASGDRIDQQRSRLDAIHARLREKKAQLDFEAAREADVRRQLTNTNAAVADVERRVGTVEEQIAAANATAGRERRELSAAVTTLDRHRKVYRRRIVDMYEASPGSTIAVLAGTRSFIDLTERWDDLRYIAASDQRELRARTAAVRAVDELYRAIGATIVHLQTERDRRMQLRAQLDGLAGERSSLLAIASAHHEHVAGEVQELEEISAQEEAALEAAVREQQAAAERQRQSAGAAPITPPASGAMQWPLHGPITSPYGMRLNPFGGGKTEYHPGIDIGVPVGTPIAAAAAGTVIIAGWVSGYGNYISIDHGGGISTGYGHLSTFMVSVGQVVQRGQTIGLSGNTGRSTGPHLIFEVRRNGTPVDPNPFL
jgi:murein DD-endopeptidase MepM/ murein hydrolase activator NlpD